MDNLLNLNDDCTDFNFFNAILNTLMESTYNAYLILDHEFRIVFYNPNLIMLFNIDKDDIEAKNLSHFIKLISQKIQNKNALKSIESCFMEKSILHIETHKILHLKNSQEVFLSVRSIHSTENILGYLFNFVNFSAAADTEHTEFNNGVLTSLYKNLQPKPLSESTYLQEISKLKAIQEELRKAKEEAERANLAKSHFLANMSHEIRTPLFGVIGLLNILKKTSLTTEQDKYIDIMQMSAESLMLIINDVLDLAKIESANIELQNTVFDIRDNLCDMLRSIAARAHDKGIEVLYEVKEDVPEAIESDLNRLRQVIINLLTNAVKFSERGEIIVSVDVDFFEDENYILHFAVKDTGIGIPDDKQSLIFDPFVQIEGSSNRKYGGTGLGLSICRKIIEMMNGGIWVESTLGKGSTFHFIIQTRGINSKNKKESGGLRSSRSSALSTNSKVLLFDGNKSSTNIHKKMLEHSGFSVKTVNINHLSLSKIKEAALESLDCKICIINAPLRGHNFSEICAAIDERKDLKKILLTNSYSKVYDSSKLIHSEVDSFLIKPIKSKELIESIQNIAQGDNKKKNTPETTVAKYSKKCRTSNNNNKHVSDLNLRVLLSEDNEVNQIIISKILTDEGHTCIITDSGQEAIDRFKKEHFDLIIMDIQMPGMDGFTTTRNIRQLEKKAGRHIPIIALSAHALPEHMSKAVEAGMDYYLTKPFRYEKFQEILDEIKHNIYASLYECVGNYENSTIENTMFKLLPQTPNLETPKASNANSFNIEELFEKLNSDSEFFKTFAEKFIDTTTNLLNEMEKSVNLMDGSLLSKSSHALKGTLSYVDAHDAVTLCIELENRGKEQDMEFADILLKKLRIEVQNIIEIFIEFIMR